MSFLPEEEVQQKASLNLAPMIDFLFLMLMLFVTLAVTRVTTKETDIELVEIKPESHSSPVSSPLEDKIIHVVLNAEGKLKWVTELNNYPLETPELIAQELRRQYEDGFLPKDKLKTHVLLKIDKNAKWEPILKTMFAIRDQGFEVRPVYEPES